MDRTRTKATNLVSLARVLFNASAKLRVWKAVSLLIWTALVAYGFDRLTPQDIRGTSYEAPAYGSRAYNSQIRS